GTSSTRTRWRPMRSEGMARARLTASAAAGPATMRLAAVRMPERCASSTASLISGARPKSSAVTMSLSGDVSALPLLEHHAPKWNRFGDHMMRLFLEFEHDVFEKVVATFSHHALGPERSAIRDVVDLIAPMDGAAGEARKVNGKSE